MSSRNNLEAAAAKVLSGGHKKKSGGGKKIGRNRKKCATYRLRVGKPAGAGSPGNKAGKNKLH